MPLPKGHFKRFNITEYMTRKRLENKEIVAKTKQARAAAVKLKRLDEKVRINCCFGLLNIYDYVSSNSLRFQAVLNHIYIKVFCI